MSEYDPTVLQQCADLLYRKARWITLCCVLAGGVIGGTVAVGLGKFAPRPYTSDFVTIALFTGLGALVGAVIGQKQRFSYRTEAQRVLCQVQIERNTRKI